MTLYQLMVGMRINKYRKHLCVCLISVLFLLSKCVKLKSGCSVSMESKKLVHSHSQRQRFLKLLIRLSPGKC